MHMKNIYTVGQVNAYIKNMFAQDYMLRSIIVSGEVSNVKYHSSGHIYFTMKDNSGALACVMFAGYTKGMNFRLADGMQIEAAGSVSVYERDGKYQLYATAIRHAGAGLLYEKYEQLKRELEEMGLFDASYKQPIPKYARRIGIVTAPTGAAVRDIIQISKRRNPYVELFLYPAQVQGDGAKESIVSGIEALQNQGMDVIIVGRGGGSIEDLWAFNEECVARAIFNCPVPIISAVGHETDTTIADYVADMRAPTPSAAAELAVFSLEEYLAKLENLSNTMTRAIERQIDRHRSEVSSRRLRLDALSPVHKIREKRLRYVNYVSMLDSLMERKLLDKKKQLSVCAARMKAMSPIDRLKQGYAYVEDSNGKPVNDVKMLSVGDNLKLNMRNGIADVCVTGTADTHF